MEAKICECFTPGATVAWTETADVGVTDDYWDVTRMRCAGCGTTWLRAFLEHEAFSRSGRFYRAATTDAAIDGVTPDAALSIIKQAPTKIAGGSRFDGVEHVVSGQGDLLASP